MRKIHDADIKNKTVLLRADFNVLVKDGEVAEDFRIRAIMPSLQYLLEKGAKRIVMTSHLGRPEGKPDPQFSLRPIARRISELFGEDVIFIDDAIGGSARDKIKKAKSRLILLENLRFYKGEEDNNSIFAQNLAALGDVFVQEAFGVCHRAHASTAGVVNFIPSYAGFLIEKETGSLDRIIKNPERPLTVLIGGAKISTKAKVIEKFLRLADRVCLGGALANTALKATGMAVGLSLVEDTVLGDIKRINFTDPHLHLPIDVKVAKDFYAKDGFLIKGVGNVVQDEIILDIGPDTQDMFAGIVRDSKTVLWNGPMGYIENKQFADGTRRIAKEVAAATAHAFTVVGGGDTYQTLQDLNLMDKVSFISTGGGAMLDYLAEGTLPGIEALK